ncbi:hypothetical protein METHP15_390042 [Pseudomonas sp. P15-2025]
MGTRALQVGPEVALLTEALVMGRLLAFDQCLELAKAGLGRLFEVGVDFSRLVIAHQPHVPGYQPNELARNFLAPEIEGWTCATR